MCINICIYIYIELNIYYAYIDRYTHIYVDQKSYRASFRPRGVPNIENLAHVRWPSGRPYSGRPSRLLAAASFSRALSTKRLNLDNPLNPKPRGYAESRNEEVSSILFGDTMVPNIE